MWSHKGRVQLLAGTVPQVRPPDRSIDRRPSIIYLYSITCSSPLSSLVAWDLTGSRVIRVIRESSFFERPIPIYFGAHISIMSCKVNLIVGFQHNIYIGMCFCLQFKVRMRKVSQREDRNAATLRYGKNLRKPLSMAATFAILVLSRIFVYCGFWRGETSPMHGCVFKERRACLSNTWLVWRTERLKRSFCAVYICIDARKDIVAMQWEYHPTAVCSSNKNGNWVNGFFKLGLGLPF